MPIFAGQSRAQLRRAYQEAWRKFQAGAPLEPLEAQIAAVVAEHPEYRLLIESGDAALEAEFTPESGQLNPFLHMGLHLAIRDQVATDRPRGIAAVHAQLRAKKGDAHAAEHEMLEVLATTIWESQRSGRPPDENLYLERLRALV
jgi:hypothetical protein